LVYGERFPPLGAAARASRDIKRPLKPGRARTPCAVHAQQAPCTSRRSARRF